MTERKFYRTVVQVEVLSDKPLGSCADDLDCINYNITEGECSGAIKVVAEEIVNGKHMADLLSKQGSDPGFFELDDEGNDVEE